MKQVRITVRFPVELRRRLKSAAQRTGRRESDLVREAVERQLAANEEGRSLYDIVKKIGTIRGGPRDLSTNPKYFEGFGES